MSAGWHGRRSLLEHLVADLSRTAERIFLAEETVRSPGLLQNLDPRVKVVGTFAWIAAATWVTKLSVVSALFLLSAVLSVTCRLPLRILASRVWLGSLAFTGCIALPAIFLTPGDPVLQLPALHWAITRQGLTTASMLVLRAETAATLGFLLVLTTPWTHVLKALRALRVPVVAVVLLSMTVRYIVLLLTTAQQMLESHRSRTVGFLDAAANRRLIYNTAGVLLGKTMQLSNEVFLAMQARGFRGEVHVLTEFHMTSRDFTTLAAFIATAGMAVWIGR